MYAKTEKIPLNDKSLILINEELIQQQKDTYSRRKISKI